MADNFFDLTKDIQRDILIGAETRINIKAPIIEKDIWICWVLNKIFSLQINMAFKGGTSLSKAYNLIDRFSEDVDITIDYNELMPDINLTNTKSALKNIHKKLKERVNQYAEETFRPALLNYFKSDFPNEILTIDISEDGEKLYIHYPSLFEQTDNYLQSNVLIELGGCNSIHPNQLHVIKPMLAEVTSDLILPIANVNVLSPLKTFWEKATLIHVECHRGRISDTPHRLSRHWYDLAKLSKSRVGKSALEDRIILKDVLAIKKAFFNASYANYDKCEQKEFCLVPNAGEIENLKSDYNKMIDSGMFSTMPLPFDNLIEEIRSLEIKINELDTIE